MPQAEERSLPTRSFCLFGTPGAQLNLGVGALRDATTHAVHRALPGSEVVVFDDGWGVRPTTTPEGPVTFCGGRDSRRYHRPESFAQMRAAIAVGGAWNAGARKILESAAVLDVSGGDSFADLYGPSRFRTVAWPKRLALAAGRPLVLLPQTYGPFRDPGLREEAARLLRGASAVWARDPRSRETADELIGEERTRLGVDMAFGLPRTPLEGAEGDAWQQWLDASPEPVAGVNVNGLLVNQPDASRAYGVTPTHREEMTEVARRILDGSEWRVVVVPHVLGEGLDSDVAVSREVAGRLQAEFGTERVHLADGCRTPGQTKAVIARCAWFTGARMHATIAALSSGVPTGGVAYSRKMEPVFERLDQPVVDARSTPSDGIVSELVALWRDHDAARDRLATTLPEVLDTWAAQIDAILAVPDTVER